jgi:hypothetical protein
VKLRLLAKENVDAPKLLSPNRIDLNYLKRFLDETARSCNQRIGERLADLITTLHNSNPTLGDARQIANGIAAAFRLPLKVVGQVGVIPLEINSIAP